MASVYTTARGKNKKHKAKDASKNGAQCRANKFDSDFARELGMVKEEALGAAALKPLTGGLTSTAFRLRMEHEQRQRELALRECSNPACPLRAEAGAEGAGGSGGESGGAGGGGGGGGGGASPPVALQRCACHLASYCSAQCQREAWDAHKAQCKAKRAEMAEIAAAVALARARAEEEARAAAEALLAEHEGEGKGEGK